MRAWLLLLAVLATFQPIVQVASTEDITSRFIQAISSPSINQQKQRQQTNFEYVENKRDARYSFNTQQLTENEVEEKSKHVTAVSPVIDITALSVTKSAASIGARSNQNSTATTTTSTSSTTSIATIFSSSDSDNSKNNNKNNLNYKFSAKKDNSASKSENTSDAAKANEIVELSEVKQKHKQIKHQNHNEVNEKSAKNTLVDPTKRNSAVTTQANKVPQQQLENTEESSAVISEEEEVEKANEQEKELQDLSEMAFEENTVATAQEAHEEHSSSSSKPHRHHKKYHQHHRHHQQQEHNQHHHHQQHHHHHHHRQHQDTQQQHLQKHHKTTHAEVKNVTEKISSATEERLAAEERLAMKVPETPKARFTLPAVEAASSTTHKAAAEKLALDSARSSVDGGSTEFSKPASHTATASITSTASMSSSDTAEVDASSDSVSDESDSDSDSDNEPATYSNKEIIGEKLKPDPSTLVQIENSLLSLFNMKRPPKIDRSKIIIPEAMKQLYAQIMGYEWDSVMIPRPGILTKSANTVRSFTHIESKIDDRFPHHHRFRLYFDVKSIPNEEKLRAAELHLSRDAISDAVFNERLANRTRYQVLAYDITRVGVRGKREPSYLLLDNKAVHLNSTETVSLDVQPAVDRWLATPKKNYGLLIEVRTSPSLKPAPHHHVRLRRSVDEPHESWQHKQPVLYTYTDDGKHKSRSIRDTSSRSKRAGHHRRAHRRKNSDEICRRHSLYVDFADVGWSDWIVAPPGYDAFYCQGKCPFPLAEHMNSTNHAVVQTLVNNLNPGKVPKACCVPTQLEGISMLYLNDQNTVVLKNYQDMTVVGCGCR